MPTEVILPKVDMDMTHGTLAVWHVAEGGVVAKGAALFDIETDKAAMEVESPANGTLHHITAAPGDKVAVGTVVAWIYAVGEDVGVDPNGVASLPETPPKAADRTVLVQPEAAALAEVAAGPQIAAQAQAVEQPQTHRFEPHSPRATPAARMAARGAGIALDGVPGSGPLGRVQRDDIAAFLQAVAPPDILADNPVVAPPAGPAIWAPEPGPLHISRRNGDGVPILMIHGFTADSQSWAPLEKALGASRPLIRIDLPGHGKSPKRRVASFAELARMMVDAFDDATRDQDSVHLLGHSLGGALAIALADIRARRVASLSLIAPAGLGPEIDAATLMGIVRASRAESLAPWLRRLTATPDAITDGYATAAMRARQNPALRAVQADMADTLFPDGVQPFDLRAALARAAMPTAIIWGRQDRIIPWQQALAPNGDFAIHLMQGAGHIPHIECPDRVAAIIAR